MTKGRFAALAVALAAAPACGGCGLGAGSGVGSVDYTVTRDYGRTVVLDRRIDDVKESDTVIRLLDRNATISTRYGGGFVQSIDGTAGGSSGGRYLDWFFYVDGVESPEGAADRTLEGGDRVWWDYRDWTAAMNVPAVVGSWPQPFAGGYDGRRHPVRVECRGGGGACAIVRGRVAAATSAGTGRTSGEPITRSGRPLEAAAIRSDRRPGGAGAPDERRVRRLRASPGSGTCSVLSIRPAGPCASSRRGRALSPPPAAMTRRRSGW